MEAADPSETLVPEQHHTPEDTVLYEYIVLFASFFYLPL
jgi:hypothetical protein